MDTLATLFTSIDYRDPIWIAVAYLFGFIVWQIGLPPLVGFLLAGFLLNVLGASGGEFLHEMADIGVTLLLFTIGLKLHIKQLLRPQVWGVATMHMLLIIMGITGFFMLLTGTELPLVNDLTPVSALLLGLALSFSSTVFAVKIFEDKGTVGSYYSVIAIGILIIQDIVAVVFLAASTAKLPSPWAVAIIVSLIAAKPLLILLLKRAGHGELLILYGLVLALGGSALFEWVSLKGDLGALFFGVLIASHPKASELAKTLLSIKELFLVGFFLSIGIAVMPTFEIVAMAALLLLIIPLKALLFFVLLSRFRLRTRNATFTALSLANFSEFGLIVAAIAVGNQWLGQEWLAVIAVAVVLSFIVAAPLNLYSEQFYQRTSHWLQKLEHRKRLVEDSPLSVGQARVLVCGMGRVGKGAFIHVRDSIGSHNVVGVDYDEVKTKRHDQDGYNVLHGDAGNPDFWLRINCTEHCIDTILLCMPNHPSNFSAAKVIRAWGFQGNISAITQFPDEAEALYKAGVNSTFNIYAEIGTGFAEDVLNRGKSPTVSINEKKYP